MIGRFAPHVRDRGFTLIELMVAMAIVGMIMTFMISGLSAGIESWERGSAAIRDMDERAGLENLIKRQLAVASRAALPTNRGDLTLFEGGRSRITFLTPYSMIDGSSDLRLVDYVVENGTFSYGERFLFEYRRDGVDAPRTQTLAEFERMEFRYLGVAEGDERFEWRDEWERDDGLPRAVEVRLDDDYVVIPLMH